MYYSHKLSGAVIIALLLISSCKEDNDEAVKPDAPKAPAITMPEMENQANKFDEQGVMYLEFLDVYKEEAEYNGDIGNWDVGQIAEYNGDIGNWDVGQVTNMLRNKSDGGDLGNWDVGQVTNMLMDYYGSKGKDSSNTAKQLFQMRLRVFSDLEFNAQTKMWVDSGWGGSLRNPVELLLDPANGGSLHERTLKYINALRAEEAKLMEKQVLNQAKKDCFLICYSIARHAAAYWYNETRNNKPNGKFSVDIIHLSTLGASTAILKTDNKDVGASTAVLSAYVAKDI